MATAKKSTKSKKSSPKPAKKATPRQIVNHVVFVCDESGSMRGVRNRFCQVYDKLITDIAQNAAQTGQQATVSSYRFSSSHNANYRLHRDAFLSLPGAVRPMSSVYSPDGGTPLIRATIDAIRQHLSVQLNPAQDHAFLIYVLTDGEENTSGMSPFELQREIAALPENFTVAILVPNQTGAHQARLFGFPAGNIQVWDAASDRGVEEGFRTVNASYASYSNLRSTGHTQTSTLFRPDLSNVKTTDVKGDLDELKGCSIHHIQTECDVRAAYLKAKGTEYEKGKLYYELLKPEKVQDYKDIVIVSTTTDKRFGGVNARSLLGVPPGDVRLGPGNHGNWRIFVQSTSYTRKIPARTSVLIRD